MARRVTDFTPDVGVVTEELFGTRVELVTLLSARFTPNFASGRDIHQNERKLLCFIGLVHNSFYHGDTFGEIFCFVGRHENVERVVIFFVRVEHSGLGSLAADRNFAF